MILLRLDVSELFSDKRGKADAAVLGLQRVDIPTKPITECAEYIEYVKCKRTSKLSTTSTADIFDL